MRRKKRSLHIWHTWSRDDVESVILVLFLVALGLDFAIYEQTHSGWALLGFGIPTLTFPLVLLYLTRYWGSRFDE